MYGWLYVRLVYEATILKFFHCRKETTEINLQQFLPAVQGSIKGAANIENDCVNGKLRIISKFYQTLGWYVRELDGRQDPVSI